MKYTLALLLIVLLIVAGCTGNKKTVATNNNNPTETQLAAVNEKFAGTTMTTLNTGFGLYFGTCTNCHAAKNISTYSEEEWPKIIDRMATKAKINADEKDAVFKYVMAVKLGSTKN